MALDRKRTALLALLVPLVLAGCGGIVLDDPAPRDVGPTRDDDVAIEELSDADRAALCDELAELFGGYRYRHVCGTVVVASFDNREQCLTAYLRPGRTSRQYLACAHDISAARAADRVCDFHDHPSDSCLALR